MFDDGTSRSTWIGLLNDDSPNCNSNECLSSEHFQFYLLWRQSIIIGLNNQNHRVSFICGVIMKFKEHNQTIDCLKSGNSSKISVLCHFDNLLLKALSNNSSNILFLANLPAAIAIKHDIFTTYYLQIFRELCINEILDPSKTKFRFLTL